MLESLVKEVHQAQGDTPCPSRVAIDSQSVKTVPFVSEDCGVGSHKKINGRKRHIIVDKYGLPIAIHVGAANLHDGSQGLELLWQLERFPRIKLLCLDSAYQGEFEEAAELYGFKTEISQKPQSSLGFVPQKGRWHAERCFSWRRLRG